MLRWRLLLGILIVAALVGLAWLDHLAEVQDPAAVPGVFLLPVAVLFAVTATGEVLRLAGGGGISPVPWAIYCGNLLLVASNWVPVVYRQDPETTPHFVPGAWPLFALAVGLSLVFVAETRRYERPGGVTASIGAAVFALVYVGVMLSFAVQLRLAWGVGALASLVIVVKTADSGAFVVGRLIGRHRMAPVLSPGKTIEGAIGGLASACLASWVTFAWLMPLMAPGAATPQPWRWTLFALLVSTAGVLGDLAESLVKRDVGRKDSSSWLPGLGGVLDMLDSILVAAPVAWFCWAVGLVGG